MKKYKEPAFQDRIASAARARNEVLAQLRAKPPVDEEVIAARVAAQRAKDEAKLEERRLAKLAAEERKAAKRAEAEEKAAAKAAAQAAAEKPELTEAERKAARDARYLARKKRASS